VGSGQKSATQFDVSRGNIVSFSTDEDPRELVLNNVTVFQNDTAAKLYDVELMYLSFDKKSVTLEVYKS